MPPKKAKPAASDAAASSTTPTEQVVLHIPYVPTESALPTPGPPGLPGLPGIAEADGGLLRNVSEVEPPGASPAPSGPSMMRGFDGMAWPRATDAACFWCCHPFETQPVGLPLRYSGGVFHVWGCFCSLECALALNHHERHGYDAAESANLVNLLAQKLGRTEPVRPAPDRYLLPLFGGGIPLEQFRNMGDRRVAVYMPPIQAVVPAVEEVTSSSGALARNDARIPLDMSRVRNAADKARTGRRSAAKNTLEATMPSLRVNPAEAGPA